MDDLLRRELLDEEPYLHTFPDVALAVRVGELSSRYEHLASCGRFGPACDQRVAGSTLLPAAIGHVDEGSGASNGLATDNPLGYSTIGGPR